MKKYIVLVVLLMGLSSCEDFLEEDAKSVQTTDNFYKTEADINSAVNAIYAFLYAPYTRGGFDDMPMAMLEMITGQWNNVSQFPETGFYYSLTNTSGSSYVLTYWENCYKGIESANQVIANIENVTFLNDTDKNSLLGEARFLRAYYYYLLVNIFGDVPMKLVPTTTPGTDGLLPKTSLVQIYGEVIVPDLAFAEQHLKFATPEGNGRVSVGAAKTLLAKVYLSMAGNPVNNAEAMQLAKEKALEVINSGAFSLFQSDATLSWFDKLNNSAFDNIGEHIWDVNYNYPDLPNSFGIYFLPEEVVFTQTGFQQFGGFYPDPAYLDSFSPEDLRGRNNMGFFYNSFTTNGETYNFPWAIYKFFDKGLLTTAPDSGKNFPLLRYADLLLTYAEAQNETDGGPDETAYRAVNDIRERAGLEPVSGLGQEAFREEVWKQRYWELGAENKTYFDIVRTQRIYDPNQNGFTDIVGFTLPSGAVVQEGSLPFPIPLKEVQINPLLSE
ncbi:MAG: RagB/SusD family nutrient uptake outer membrane protein [Sediminicola sp.]